MKKLLLLLAQTLMLLCIALPSIVFAAKDSAPIAEMKYDGKTATTLHYRDLSVTADIQTAQDPTACANASDVGKSSCKTIVVTGTAGGKAAFTFDVPNDVDSLDMLNVDVTLRRLDPARPCGQT